MAAAAAVAAAATETAIWEHSSVQCCLLGVTVWFIRLALVAAAAAGRRSLADDWSAVVIRRCWMVAAR